MPHLAKLKVDDEGVTLHKKQSHYLLISDINPDKIYPIGIGAFYSSEFKDFDESPLIGKIFTVDNSFMKFNFTEEGLLECNRIKNGAILRIDEIQYIVEVLPLFYVLRSSNADNLVLIR